MGGVSSVFTLLARFLSLWPLKALHVLGGLLGWVAYLASPTYRSRFKANTAQAGLSPQEVRPAIAHTGRMMVEIPRIWLHPQTAPHTWIGLEKVQAAYAKGQGVLILTPHMGCFEIMAQAWALQFSQSKGQFVVLFRPPRKAWMADLVNRSRNKPGLQAVPTNATGVRQLIKALRQGRAVGLLPDQVPPEGMGLWAPFFGKPAYTMTLAAKLALQTGAVVLTGWSERLPKGQGFLIHIFELSQPLASDLESAVTQLNVEMERLIRRCPQQYLWGYGRYKNPRVADAAIEPPPSV